MRQKKNLKSMKIYAKNADILLGILFIAVFVVSGFFFIQQKLWYEFFWLSNHWALINGIGFLTRKKFVFSYIVVLGIVPELLWVLDFFFMSFNQPFLGITNYWFNQDYSPYLKVISLQHLLNPFASLYAIARFGFHKKAWVGALVHGIAVWLISLMLLDKKYNVNCVWTNCISFIQMSNLAWQIILLLAMALHIWLITHLVHFFTKTSKLYKNTRVKRF